MLQPGPHYSDESVRCVHVLLQNSRWSLELNVHALQYVIGLSVNHFYMLQKALHWFVVLQQDLPPKSHCFVEHGHMLQHDPHWSVEHGHVLQQDPHWFVVHGHVLQQDPNWSVESIVHPNELQ